MRRYIYYIVIVLLLLSPLQVKAGDPDKMVASFVFNLVDYIRWPADVRKKVVNICSYGDDDVANNISNLDPNGTNSVNRLYTDKVVTKKYESIESIENCDLLYISEDKERFLRKVVAKANKNKIFTVSKIKNFVEYGGALEVKIARNRVKVKLDEKSLKKTGVKLSPVLLTSASPNIRKNTYSASR